VEDDDDLMICPTPFRLYRALLSRTGVDDVERSRRAAAAAAAAMAAGEKGRMSASSAERRTATRLVELIMTMKHRWIAPQRRGLYGNKRFPGIIKKSSRTKV